MNDAGFAMSVGYASLLEGLTYLGKPVKAYDQVADDSAVPPYVIVGPWIGKSDNTKDSFCQDGLMTHQVVTRFAGNVGSRKPATEIANLICNRIKPNLTSEPLVVPGFQVWKTVIDSVEDQMESTKTDRVFRKFITVSHSLKQV